jgi:hypothetical protein
MNIARVKIAFLALAAFLVAIQIVQPKRLNPPVVPSRSLASHEKVPGEVQTILNRACGDCHSNETSWPWYSHLAPLSWVITDDVNQGRRHMNFQDWDAQTSPREAHDHILDICTEVQQKGMPPFSYRLVHPDSRLNPMEIAAICSWTQSFGAAPEQGR